MIKTLLKAQLGSLGALMSGKQNTKRKKNGKIKKTGAGKTVLFTLLFAYVAVCFLGMFFGISVGLGTMLLDGSAQGAAAYAATLSFIAFFLCFVGTVFATEKQIYESRDNEMLLSMPVKPSAIVISRLLSLYIMNLAFTAVALIPSLFVALVIYGSSVNIPFMIIGYILLLVFIPLISLAVTAAIAALFAFISSRVPFKNVMTVILSLAVIALYFYFYMNMDKFLTAAANICTQAAMAIPIFRYGGEMCAGNILSLLLFLIWTIVPFAVVIYAISKSFYTIANSNRGERKVKYREKQLTVSSPLHAIVNKEAARFFSLPAYMINSGLGVMLQLFAPIILIIKKNDILTMLDGIKDMIPFVNIGALIPAALAVLSCACVALNAITAPSISLERDKIWQIKVMPVSARDVLAGKLTFGCLVPLPTTVIYAVVTSIAFNIGIGGFLITLLVPLFITVSANAYGLCCNLWLPNLEFAADINAIKQSGASMLAVFGSMLIYIAPVMGAMVLGAVMSSSAIVALLICAYAAILGVIFFAYIFTGGTKKFENEIGMS